MPVDTRSRGRFIHYNLIVIVFILLCGCSNDSRSPLRVGTTLWPGYEPLHLAANLGYIDSQSIVLVDSISPHGSIQGIRNGDLDAVALTLDEVLLLVDQGVALKVVLVFDFSNGGDALLATKGIDDVAMLKGKRIGLESTALGTYLLSRALEQHGLDLEDVEKYHIKVSGHRQALERGEVDAVVTFDPVRSELLAAGAREIFSSRDIPNEIVDVLAVRESYINQHPQRVHELINGWYQALDYFSAQPQAAAEIMGKRLRQSPAEVLQGFTGIKLPGRVETRALMHTEGEMEPPLYIATRRLYATMRKQQMLLGKFDIDSIITPDYLN